MNWIIDESNIAPAHVTIICREYGEYRVQSEKYPIATRTYRLQCHSWESSKINSWIARHSAFVLFALSSPRRYFLYLGRCISSKIPIFPTTYDKQSWFPSHVTFNVKDKISNILARARKWNFLLAWKETAKPRVLNSSLRRLPR